MKRPLIISDCDEVLLHMVVPFKQWLEESQGVVFQLEGKGFAEALRWAESGEPLEHADVWRLLGGFFDSQMDRQMPIAGAVEAMRKLRDHADVVILTNLVDERRERRALQLSEHGIDAPVYTNQGPKGPAIRSILAEYDPPLAFFIDDLPQHHRSAAEDVPQVRRLHFCGESLLAPHIECAHAAGDAHARIDEWSGALEWLLMQMDRR